VNLLVFLLLASKADVMDSVVRDSAAMSHIGQIVTLDCNVVNVKLAHNGIVFVDCGGLYPNMQASLVVFANNAGPMVDLEQYKGKHVLVHGMLKLYKGKPEIILNSQAQIQGAH
jgi:hypothetical protein